MRKVRTIVCYHRQLGHQGIVTAVRRGRLDGDAMPDDPYWRTSNRPLWEAVASTVEIRREM